RRHDLPRFPEAPMIEQRDRTGVSPADRLLGLARDGERRNVMALRRGASRGRTRRTPSWRRRWSSQVARAELPNSLGKYHRLASRPGLPTSRRWSDPAGERETAVARNERHLVGLDVGTSKIAAIVGEMTAGAGVDIIGLGLADSRGVRRGV